MHVKRTTDHVWIDGVQGFSPGEYASSVHGAQAVILRSVGSNIGYDDLVCFGAFAFRIGLHDKMCPSAGHPCCGFMCIENSNRALPWSQRLFEAFPWGPPRPDQAAFEAEACAAIKASIERGIPVHYGSEEDGVIIGYGDDGRRWWCLHPYHKGGREAFWHDEVGGFAGGRWPWGMAVWTSPKGDEERVSRRELTIAALRQAVEMWHTEKRGDYFVGEAAYGQWLKWLRDVDSGKVSDPKGGMQGNGWCYDVLVHGRRIAGRWLRQNAGSFETRAAELLLAAAEHCAQLAEGCMKGLACPWDLTLGPNRFDAWTAAMRQDQMARLEAAREHDRATIAAVTEALQTLG